MRPVYRLALLLGLGCATLLSGSHRPSSSAAPPLFPSLAPRPPRPLYAICDAHEAPNGNSTALATLAQVRLEQTTCSRLLVSEPQPRHAARIFYAPLAAGCFVAGAAAALALARLFGVAAASFRRAAGPTEPAPQPHVGGATPQVGVSGCETAPLTAFGATPQRAGAPPSPVVAGGAGGAVGCASPQPGAATPAGAAAAACVGAGVGSGWEEGEGLPPRSQSQAPVTGPRAAAAAGRPWRRDGAGRLASD